jgi:Stage II sporulation protein E (SpoIIE)
MRRTPPGTGTDSWQRPAPGPGGSDINQFGPTTAPNPAPDHSPSEPPSTGSRRADVGGDVLDVQLTPTGARALVADVDGQGLAAGSAGRDRAGQLPGGLRSPRLRSDTFTLTPGDRLVVYTDGLLQGHRRHGAPVPLAQQISRLSAVHSSDAAKHLNELRSGRDGASRTRTGDWDDGGDATVLIVDVARWPAAATSGRR